MVIVVIFVCTLVIDKNGLIMGRIKGQGTFRGGRPMTGGKDKVTFMVSDGIIDELKVCYIMERDRKFGGRVSMNLYFESILSDYISRLNAEGEVDRYKGIIEEILRKKKA